MLRDMTSLWAHPLASRWHVLPVLGARSFGSFDSTAKSGRLTTRTFWHMHTNVPYIVHAEPTSVVDDLCDTLQTDVIRVAVDGNQAGHSCILFIVMVVRLFGRSSRTRLFMYESPK